ncbi:MAG: beta-lactamase domain protein [Xanthobacteraceae bacterium]|jgi:glyoxylase-like metal-dependent hydrolase (beta-lactamase superfamily II)|nr:beta-lactamase domain protein [Xanthobacteraceae bacterium]
MWRPVAGASGVEIFALINKPSITNSNAYLIRTATRILIIDPGAEHDQVSRINALVAESLAADRLEDRAREVSLLLSHAHLDHFRAVGHLDVGLRPRTVVHAAGASAMRNEDRDHTLAILYRNAAIPDLAIDEEFFGEAPLAGGRRRMETIGGSHVAVETLEIGPGIVMEVYPTPGHSTCSVTFRIGRELIIGDVPFGASPGLAGLSGWSSEELRASTHRIRALIAAHGIETCWTGHGRPLEGAAAVATLADVERQLGDLGEIVRIDEERITLLRQFAIELLREIERLMALVGARLLLAASHLEQLEESEEAARLADAIDFDEIDGLLSEFREFARGFERGDQPELSVAMKAGATVGRIARAVERFQPVGPRPLTMIGRIEYLIDAFLQAIRGLMFPLPTEATDLVAMVRQMIQREQAPAHHAEEFLAAADDKEAFRRLLAENLISSHALWRCEVRLHSAEPELVAEVDPIAFQMVLLSTLETLASQRDGATLTVDIQRRGGDAVLLVGCGAPPAIPPTRAALYHRAMDRMRGSYEVGAAQAVITAPLA